MAKNEFQEYAEECMGWAKTAKTEQERKIFLEMAATWLDAATRLEIRGRGGVTYDPIKVTDASETEANI